MEWSAKLTSILDFRGRAHLVEQRVANPWLPAFTGGHEAKGLGARLSFVQVHLGVSRVSQLVTPIFGEVCKTAIGQATCIQREETGSSCIQRIGLGKRDPMHFMAFGIMVCANKQRSLKGEIRETGN